MDDNTAMAIVLSVLFGSIGLACIAFAIACALVRRAEERTKQLRLEHEAHPPEQVEFVPKPGGSGWPEYTIKRTTLPREDAEEGE